MKNLSLPCTEENLLKVYAMDAVGRNRFLRHFIEALNNLDECTIIGLDSQWGSGKTFFVKQVKYILDATNPLFKTPDKPRPDILDEFEKCWKEENLKWRKRKARLYRDMDWKQEIGELSQFCVYYDAWKHDSEGDPLLSLVYDIYAQMETDYSFSEVNSLKEIFKDFASLSAPLPNQWGVSLNPISVLCNLVAKDKPFEEIQAAIDLEQKIHEFLNTLLPERGMRLVIFIDELDRCNPAFAVRLLEKIKHYFNHENITFVLSIDATELEATIKHYYGSEFNAHLYLDRFLDYHFSLPKVKTDEYLSLVDERIGSVEVVRFLVETYNFQMRQITRYVQLLKVAIPYRYYYREYEADKTQSFLYRIFVPFLIALKISSQESYNRFISGEDYRPLTLFITPRGLPFISDLHKEGESLATIDENLQHFYKSLFHAWGGFSSMRVGTLKILESHRTRLEEIISFMSDFSTYLDNDN